MAALRTVLAALLWGCAARAAEPATQPTVPHPTAPAALLPEILHYTISLHGIALLEGSFCFGLGAASYEAGLTAHTVGLVDLLVHGSSVLHVDGTIDPAGAVHPRAYAEHSRLSGEDYGVAMGFADGRPVLRDQHPPQERYRLPIPDDALPGAIDGLSAVAVQSLAAAQGRCPGDVRLYDGRQVRLLSMRGETVDTLDRGRSAFAGRALRCETSSTMLAGYLKSSPVDGQSRPRRGRLWLAPARPGGPPLPVRKAIDADAFGDAVIRLDAASQALAPGCGGEGWAGGKPR